MYHNLDMCIILRTVLSGNSAGASDEITECIPYRGGRIRATFDHTASTKSLRENKILCAAVESSIGKGHTYVS